MASFVLRDLPPWWEEVRAKAQAQGWPLHALIIEMLAHYHEGSLVVPDRGSPEKPTSPVDTHAGIRYRSR